MEEQTSVQVIRQMARDSLTLHRRIDKDKARDEARSLNLRASQASLVEIVKKLKTKSAISGKELNILKNGIVDDEGISTIVLSTHGALRGLVRELTGSNVSRQCAAAGCLCNLSTGGTRGCLAVTKAAGPYLVAALDSMTLELAVTCAWTLGNLAGSCQSSGLSDRTSDTPDRTSDASDRTSDTVCHILIAQGALTKLTDLLHDHKTDMKDAAMYAVTHFVYQLKDKLSPEHLNKSWLALQNGHLYKSSTQLLFALSCHKDFSSNLISEGFLQRLLETLLKSMKEHLNNPEQSDLWNLVYLFRIFANIPDSNVYSVVNRYFIENNLVSIISMLLISDNEILITSLLWFLGNLCKYSTDNVFVNELF